MGTCGSNVRRNKNMIPMKDSKKPAENHAKPSNTTETQYYRLPIADNYSQEGEISSKEEKAQSEENNVEVHEKEENNAENYENVGTLNKEHDLADKKAEAPTENFDGNTEIIDDVFKGNQQIYLMEGPFNLKPTFGMNSELLKLKNRPLTDVDDWLIELKKIVDDEIKTIDETAHEITN